MEVARSKQRISVSQSKYVLDLLKKTNMLGCKLMDTPMDPNMELGEHLTNDPMNKGRYQNLVRELIYLSYIRPNIAFTLSCVSQFMHSTSEEHMEVVYQILKYLKGNLGRGISFRKLKREA